MAGPLATQLRAYAPAIIKESSVTGRACHSACVRTHFPTLSRQAAQPSHHATRAGQSGRQQGEQPQTTRGPHFLHWDCRETRVSVERHIMEACIHSHINTRCSDDSGARTWSPWLGAQSRRSLVPDTCRWPLATL